MKKPFKETTIGKILTGKVVGGIVKTIPFGIGSLASNILDEVNGSESGSIDKKTITPQLIKIAIYGLLAYLAIRGVITFDDAEAAKQFIGQ